MILRRIIPLAFWLSTILLMAAGILVPGVASAHPGHTDERQPREIVRFHASLDTLSLHIHKAPATAFLNGDDQQAIYPALLVMQPDGERTCVGATCCGTGHGCCAAYLAGWHDPAPPPAGNRLAIALVGAPPGRGTSALPEPPRLFR